MQGMDENDKKKRTIFHTNFFTSQRESQFVNILHWHKVCYPEISLFYFVMVCMHLKNTNQVYIVHHKSAHIMHDNTIDERLNKVSIRLHLFDKWKCFICANL
jgi:hypothetical protein